MWVYKSIHNNLISYAFQVDKKGIFVYYIITKSWVWYSNTTILKHQQEVLGDYIPSSLLDILITTGMNEQDVIDGINENIQEWSEIVNPKKIGVKYGVIGKQGNQVK